MLHEMNKFIFCILLGFSPMQAFSSDKPNGDIDVMQNYHCVYTSFFNQISRPDPIREDQDFNLDGLRLIESRMDNSVRRALIEAADRTSKRINVKKNEDKIDPAIFFDVFVGELQSSLTSYINFDRCAEVEDLNSAIFDVSVNRYVSALIGKGNIHQWFVENGGTYVQSAFIVALVGIDLSGQEVDLDVWKRFYISYVRRKFSKQQ